MRLALLTSLWQVPCPGYPARSVSSAGARCWSRKNNVTASRRVARNQDRTQGSCAAYVLVNGATRHRESRRLVSGTCAFATSEYKKFTRDDFCSLFKQEMRSKTANNISPIWHTFRKINGCWSDECKFNRKSSPRRASICFLLDWSLIYCWSII